MEEEQMKHLGGISLTKIRHFGLEKILTYTKSVSLILLNIYFFKRSFKKKN